MGRGRLLTYNKMGRPPKNLGLMKPTNSKFIDDMNEAQILIEIRKAERGVNSAANEVERRQNTQSIQFFNDITTNYKGGVGGGAVNAKYQRMQKKWDSDMRALSIAEKKLKDRQDRLSQLKNALSKVKGTGKTINIIQKEKDDIQKQIKKQSVKKITQGVKLSSAIDYIKEKTGFAVSINPNKSSRTKLTIQADENARDALFNLSFDEKSPFRIEPNGGFGWVVTKRRK